MIKKLTNIFIFSIFLIHASCGFKVVNNEQRVNFKIKEIITKGDKRINFKIKNNLNIFLNNENKNIILVKIETDKDKTIKEKNIKNEITKYQITINTTVTVNNIRNGSKNIDTLIETGSFSVSKNNSTTLSNEKKLIDNLADQLSEQIVENIQRKLNDN